MASELQTGAPAPGGDTQPLCVPSKPALAGSEPRHTAPLGSRELHAVREREGKLFKHRPRNRLCRAAGGTAPSGGSEPHEVGSVGATVHGFAGPQADGPLGGAGSYTQ